VRKPAVVTIGAFDGIHIGHRRILDEVVLLARGLGVRGVVLTFDPHPMSVLQPIEAPCLLTPFKEKAGLIGETGVDDLVLLRFSPKLASQSAEWFVKNILLKKLNMRRLVIGYDFRFGRDRQGDALYLESLGEAAGFGVDIVPPVNFRDHPVSSTRVRTALLRGDVNSAARMLGRMYSFTGWVVRGEGRGVVLRYPTANLDLRDTQKMLPAKGVYAVSARLGERKTPGALYIGTKPTFAGQARTVEVHMLGLEGNLYGKRVEVSFVERLRDEVRFEDGAHLSKAIRRDVARAKRILSI
jgi:riboflavin kinase/FMN adenylyltransferase